MGERVRWQEEAQCKTRDPELYYTENIPYGPCSPSYHPYARSLCKGCPVLRDCAAEARAFRDLGVVRAGVPLTDNWKYNDDGKYDMLEHIEKTGEFPPLPEPEPLDDMGAQIFEQLPTRGNNEEFLYEGEWYVDNETASKRLGVSVNTFKRYRREGTVELKHITLRRSRNRGRPGIYFLASEVQEEKERLAIVRALESVG